MRCFQKGGLSLKVEEQVKPNIEGLLILSSPLHHDERGYFVENWRKVDLLQYGVPESFFQGKLQNNVSVSKKGTIRGMHCQGWAKLMTVASGTFRMCFVDLRLSSSTYKAVDVIDVVPGTAIFVPAGVSNGAQALTDKGILNYLVTGYYDPSLKHSGIMPLDKTLNLPWELTGEVIISSKDQQSNSYLSIIQKIESSRKKIAVIGYTGVIGSKVYEQLKFFKQYEVDGFNRDNLSELLQQEYDCVICTAPSSEKFKTNIGLANPEEEIEVLVDTIAKVKTKQFILVSSQSALHAENRYGQVQNEVCQAVLQHHQNHSIYFMDTLYGDNLKKGFVHDLIDRQWNFVSKEQLEKIPALQEYYRPVTEQVAERVQEVPLELLEQLPPVSSLYEDKDIYQVTAIEDLVQTLLQELFDSKGMVFQIKDTVSYTGQQIKELFEKPDHSKLGQYFTKNKEKSGESLL